MFYKLSGMHKLKKEKKKTIPIISTNHHRNKMQQTKPSLKRKTETALQLKEVRYVANFLIWIDVMACARVIFSHGKCLIVLVNTSHCTIMYNYTSNEPRCTSDNVTF